MKYAIAGTGAIGGYYGAKLWKAGYDVHFLLRSDYSQVQEKGLKVRSLVEDDIDVFPVNAYQNSSEMPRCDAVVVAFKTVSNGSLESVLPNVLNDNGIVVLLQNGMGEEEKIIRIPCVKRIVSGLCFICSTKMNPGEIIHKDYGKVTFAPYIEGGGSGEAFKVLGTIENDFKSAAIETAVEKDLLLARWKKLVWNIPFSGLSVLLDRNTKEIIEDSSLRGRIRDIMKEIIKAAAAYGKNINESFIDKMISNTEKMIPYYPSMKIDYDNNKEMEIESLYKVPVDMAGSRGVNMPLTEELYTELKNLR